MQAIVYNADCPDVDFLVIARALEEFRREVKGSAAEGAAKFFLFVDCPPKITQFYIAMYQHDVLRLYVSVENLVFVHQMHCIKKVTDNERSGFL